MVYVNKQAMRACVCVRKWLIHGLPFAWGNGCSYGLLQGLWVNSTRLFLYLYTHCSKHAPARQTRSPRGNITGSHISEMCVTHPLSLVFHPQSNTHMYRHRHRHTHTRRANERHSNQAVRSAPPALRGFVWVRVCQPRCHDRALSQVTFPGADS